MKFGFSNLKLTLGQKRLLLLILFVLGSGALLLPLFVHAQQAAVTVVTGSTTDGKWYARVNNQLDKEIQSVSWTSCTPGTDPFGQSVPGNCAGAQFDTKGEEIFFTPMDASFIPGAPVNYAEGGQYVKALVGFADGSSVTTSFARLPNGVMHCTISGKDISCTAQGVIGTAMEQKMVWQFADPSTHLADFRHLPPQTAFTYTLSCGILSLRAIATDSVGKVVWETGDTEIQISPGCYRIGLPFVISQTKFIILGEKP